MKTIHGKLSALLLETVGKRLSAALAVAVLLGLATTATAVTIAAGGHAYDVGTGMSPYDHGGYLFFGTVGPNSGMSAGNAFNTSSANNTVALPAYVSSISTAGLTQLAWGYNYSNIQPTAAGPTIESGVGYLSGVTTGTEYPLLDIKFASTGPLPAVVPIGIYVNGEAALNQSPSALRLQGPAGPSDSVSLAVNQTFSGSHPLGGNDLYFFNVSPTPGSTYELFATAGPSPIGNLTIAGVTFVPEPGAFGMLAAGSLGLMALVRTARRRRD